MQRDGSAETRKLTKNGNVSKQMKSRHAMEQARYRKKMERKGITQMTLLVPVKHRRKIIDIARRLRDGRSLRKAATLTLKSGRTRRSTPRKRRREREEQT